MDALAPILILMACLVPAGWLAHRADRDERFAKRLAAAVVAAIIITLAFAIARGELLRFAPGASDSGVEDDSRL